MDIKKITGLESSGELVLTKGISNLVIGASDPFGTIANERISIWVEKKDGTQDIARSVLLKDFIALGCYGEDSIQYGTKGADLLKTIANVELTEDGGYIELFENETIKISLTDLDSGIDYHLTGLEGVSPSTNLRKYERKVMSDSATSQDYDLRGYDLLSLEKSASIEEIDFRMDNGTTIKMTPFEMEVVQKSIDPIQWFNEKTVQGFGGTPYQIFIVENEIPNRIVFPLLGVNSMTIRKVPGSAINVSLRIDSNDYLQFGHHTN